MTDQLKPVREGSRWRFVKPDAEEVADWFKNVQIEGDLSHESYIGGVVLIPAKEKVNKQTDKGIAEVYEMTFTPYVRVDTRVAYAYDYAEVRELVFAKEPVGGGADGLPPGFWWFTPRNGQSVVPYLCCSMRVAFYRAQDWFDGPRTNDDAPLGVRPLRWGTATKQVPLLSWSKVDDNVLAKAETGAVGRALGMAGILVVGTGVATAEDMQELREAPSEPEAALPAAVSQDDESRTNERLIALQAALRPREDTWREFAAWWSERSKEGGWAAISDAPLEVRRGVVMKMERMVEESEPAKAAAEASA